jgi:hypothetical protein
LAKIGSENQKKEITQFQKVKLKLLESANLPLDTKSIIPEALLIGNPVLMNLQQLPFDRALLSLSKGSGRTEILLTH